MEVDKNRRRAVLLGTGSALLVLTALRESGSVEVDLYRSEGARGLDLAMAESLSETQELLDTE